MDEMKNFMTFRPFADDAAVCSFDGLEIENGLDQMAVYGNLALARDQRSKKLAIEISRVFLKIAAEIGDDAPEVAESPAAAPVEIVANPFA
jgi:predicted secreted protein